MGLKLVMTLLVRDEDDIVKQNIDFHLRQGVDHIIATDNGSTDRTREILATYQDKGVLHLIDEPGRNYLQAQWVNRMAAIACERFAADLLFHCDADEFWCAADGDLKSELASTPGLDLLFVKRFNVLLESRGGTEAFPRDMRFAVTGPLQRGPGATGGEPANDLLFAIRDKVMLRTTSGPIPVGTGNHNVKRGPFIRMLGDKRAGGATLIRRGLRAFLVSAVSGNITIYHFPIRSRAQFLRKVSHAGEAIECRDWRHWRKMGHWRNWYALQTRGELEAEYQRLLLSPEHIPDLASSGVISPIAPVLGGPVLEPLD
jgi:hypothetical protein